MTVIYKPKREDLARSKDIVKTISENTGLTKVEARMFLYAFIEAIRGYLARGVPVYLEQFGIWEYRYRKARTVNITVRHGKNKGQVRTSVQPDRWVVKFKPASGLKGVANHNAEPQLPKWSTGHTLPVGKLARLIPSTAFRPTNQPKNRYRKRPPSTPGQTAPGAECSTHSQDPGSGKAPPGTPEVAAADTASSLGQTPGTGSSDASSGATAGGSAPAAAAPAAPPTPSQPAAAPKGPTPVRPAGRPTTR